MNRDDILGKAEERIRAHRTAEAKLTVTDASGKPVAGGQAKIRLNKHEFKIGCNAFALFSIKDPGLQKAYDDAFAGLLNYATLPFYWGGYEPEKGRIQEENRMKMAGWCAEKEIIAKGHPLAWHEVFPKWGHGLPDAEVIQRQEARVREIVAKFQGKVDIWDVVNEATVSHRFENAVGRWIKEKGAAACVGDALSWARSASAGATLLYNDFNISKDFEGLVQALLDARAPMDVIGIQSHMHQGNWTIEKAWETCETYARFKLPLHFTEFTIVSGRLKDPDEKDWHKRHTDWHSTPEGEKTQLEAGSAIYTTLFSHPAVEAITWWDFSDYHAWQGAPAGMVRKDMSPKPLYEWLQESFQKRWATNASVEIGSDGKAAAQCFFGEHEVEITLTNGKKVKGEFHLKRKGEREVRVECK